MRENTRCEVDEPISTPTLSTTISSSSTSERPVLEKKMRPPCASSSVIVPIEPNPSHARPKRAATMTVAPRSKSRAREFRHHGALLVEVGLHSARHPFLLELRLVFSADEGVFHPVWDRRAALGDIHRGVVGVLLAGRARLAARIVRPEPGRQPQRILRRAEVLVVPARAAGGRRHHADGLVVDALDLVGMAVLPGSDAVSFRPGIGVALALQADQHGGRCMGVSLGIAAVLV